MNTKMNKNKTQQEKGRTKWGFDFACLTRPFRTPYVSLAINGGGNLMCF